MTFYSPDTQILFNDLYLLPQKGAISGGTGRPPNSYAVLVEGGSVLFDAPYTWVLAGVRALADAGHPPRALVLSHRNVAGQGDAFAELIDAYGLTVFLHPDDAAHPEARRAGVSFENPVGSELLEDAGLEPVPFPGHTAGSIMLYWPAQGGALLAGDSAVGPGPRQNAEPARLERPLGPTRAMTDALAEAWRTLVLTGKPLRSLLPLHGAPYVDRDDLSSIMRPLYEGEPMNPSGG